MTENVCKLSSPWLDISLSLLGVEVGAQFFDLLVESNEQQDVWMY